jgi:hypothetical protein
MGIIFSKIEKYFDKKYRYNNYQYDSEYDSIIKNEEKNQYEEDDVLFMITNKPKLIITINN